MTLSHYTEIHCTHHFYVAIAIRARMQAHVIGMIPSIAVQRRVIYVYNCSIVVYYQSFARMAMLQCVMRPLVHLIDIH